MLVNDLHDIEGRAHCCTVFTDKEPSTKGVESRVLVERWKKHRPVGSTRVGENVGKLILEVQTAEFARGSKRNLMVRERASVSVSASK